MAEITLEDLYGGVGNISDIVYKNEQDIISLKDKVNDAYSPTNKPTPAEVGALPVAGGTMIGDIKLGSTSANITGSGDKVILRDHYNGNVTLSATNSQLYLGYENTTHVRLQKDLISSTGAKLIDAQDNTLWDNGKRVYSENFRPKSDFTAFGSITNTGDLNTVTPSAGGFQYHFNVYPSADHSFPASNNANGLLTFNTHGGEYYHQIGLSSNGNLYHRPTRTGTWGKIYSSINKPTPAEIDAYTKGESDSRFVGALSDVRPTDNDANKVASGYRFYEMTGTKVNVPGGSGNLLSFARDYSEGAMQFGSQLYLDGGRFWYRGASSGTFNEWKEIYHEGHKPTFAELGHTNHTWNATGIAAGQGLTFNGKTTIGGANDSWLRLNPHSQFASGIYAGQSMIRTDQDSGFQVNDWGTNASATMRSASDVGWSSAGNAAFSYLQTNSSGAHWLLASYKDRTNIRSGIQVLSHDDGGMRFFTNLRGKYIEFAAGNIYIPNGTMNIKGKEVYHEGHKPTASELGFVSDFSATKSGNITDDTVAEFVSYNSTTVGAPPITASSNTFGTVINIPYANNESGRSTQIAHDMSSNTMWFKDRSVTTWNQVYSTNHKPTPAEVGALPADGKAVDSDKLDGLNSTQFLRSDTSATMTGDLNIDKNAPRLFLKGDMNAADSGKIYVTEGGVHGGWMGYNGSTNRVSYGYRADSVDGEVFSHPYNSNLITFATCPSVTSTQASATNSLTRKDYVDTKLAKGGGTMTGDLFLNGTRNNVVSATDQLKVNGYGIMGNRTAVYLTNGSASGKVEIGVGGIHNATTGRLTIDKDKVTSTKQMYVGSSQVYHEGHKPTPAEIGAYTKSEADGRFLGKTAKAASAAQADKVIVNASTSSSWYPVVWHNNSNTLYDTVGAFDFHPSTKELKLGGNITAYSDRRVKDNIEVISDALNKVCQLNGVTYTRTDHEDKEKRHTGVIAQEVEAVLPEVVATFDHDGIEDFKSVAYGNMVGLLIEAIKELRKEIEELKSK